MTRARALLAAAASVLLLAACAPEPRLPAPATEGQAKQQMAEQSRQWWEAMFPDEPMPVVDPIEYISVDDPDDRRADCVRQANIDGLIATADPGSQALADRIQFICSMEYPYALSDPASLGILSDAEYEWNWNYNQKRLVPCLQLLGFTVINRVGEYIEGSRASWSPYYEMAPTTLSEAEWARIDLACPPSPIGPLFRPTSG
jgi:hypothetical protein